MKPNQVMMNHVMMIILVVKNSMLNLAIILAVKDHAIRTRSIERKRTNRESPRESERFILEGIGTEKERYYEVIDISASGLEEQEKHRDEVLAVKDHAIRSRSIERKKQTENHLESLKHLSYNQKCLKEDHLHLAGNRRAWHDHLADREHWD